MSSSSSPPSNFSRLCNLLNDSLLPHIETKSILLTKEKEKDLLILLSQISRKIKAWTNELGQDSEQEIGVNFASNHNCCHALDPLSREGYNCVANFVYILVTFLTIENQYVRHAAGNIPVVIFDFLVQSGSDGKIFFQMLWASLEAVILKIHSSTLSGSNISGEERLARCNTHTADYHTTGFISILLPKLLNANWATATGLVQVLRKILKSLKTDYGELAEEYLQSFSYSLQNVSWDLLHESHVDKFSGTWMKYSKDSSLHRDMCSPGLKEIFLGTLLQLFCTLVDPNSFKETSGSNFDELPFLPEVINLVPSLLCWCLSSRVNCKQSYMSRYLRHKMLMLMIRLSFHIHHQCSTIVLWLQLLRQYFEDLLHKPVSELDDDFDNCLEGSPFQLCVADGENVHSLCTPHLQRQAIFLLFKCSFSLISFSEETGRKCPCTEREHCRMTGLSELSEWLQRHVPPEKFVDYDTSLKICSSFALSFLQLYMHEDDFLFEMLLQLLSTASPSESIQFKQNDNIIEEVKGDKYLYISSIFNPIHLFHLFLAEVRLYVSREYLFACQKELFFFLCECQFSCFYFSDLSPLSTSS
eukprot:TRINITY_DN13416_c0_g1_i7.p1 TRINITY_DN13416_c0_g1~~TRINITY_DN13416_c0_g1_i7.p1  ORF type:complete len:586 (-),score=71.93 TRINITY_DN13416_c0_g1_i7:1324-3081(-)